MVPSLVLCSCLLRLSISLPEYIQNSSGAGYRWLVENGDNIESLVLQRLSAFARICPTTLSATYHAKHVGEKWFHWLYVHHSTES